MTTCGIALQFGPTALGLSIGRRLAWMRFITPSLVVVRFLEHPIRPGKGHPRVLW